MPTTQSLDETFTSLPLDELADAALGRATALGASHADVRIERIATGHRSYRDARLENSTADTDLGLAVRVIFHGAWGFAADVALTADAAATVAEQAIATARISADLVPHRTELADEPVHRGEWVSSYEVNPFTVDDAEIDQRFGDLSATLLAADCVQHSSATLMTVQENKFYADTAGSRTVQQRVRLHPEFTAIQVGSDGFNSMRTLAPPVGRGWEYLTGTGWDFDTEITEIPSLLDEHAKAPTVEPGPKDLVIAPTNLWLTIHESIAHGTELDRALGYEAAYAGTSFATFDQLGTLAYGSEHLNVTGDRTTEHGLATIGWDDEGVAAQEFDIISGGTLTGYQLNRQMAREKGLGRSNGCAFADSPGHIPLQRMPNVSVAADPNGPDTSELVSRVEDGLLVLGDKSWSIDMQRYNFQFTGQRFHRIRNGEIVGQVKDAAYQATTTEFWGSMEAVGGPQTWLLAGAFNCGKGQPGQVAAVSHGAPSALFRGVNVLNTRTEGGTK